METTINFLRNLFGYTYVVNLGSKEIHDLNKSDSKCRIGMITKKSYVTKRKMLKMCNSKEYNGCSKCNKQLDRG